MAKSSLKNRINIYLKRKQLLHSQEYTQLEKPFLLKSRKNFAVANLLFKISDQEELKKMLNITTDFETYDWIISVSYYAMYMAALAALARLGIKSQSHAATIIVLEHHYVREQKQLDPKHIDKLTKAYSLSEDLIIKLMQTKTKRETAQYEATPAISKENAISSLQDADEFITKIEEILI